MAELSEYVAEGSNPENRKGVTAVEAYCPSPLLARGLCLVDTPGLGSVFADNTAETEAFVPQLDAALVVLDGDPPISGEEVGLLEEVARGRGERGHRDGTDAPLSRERERVLVGTVVFVRVLLGDLHQEDAVVHHESDQQHAINQQGGVERRVGPRVGGDGAHQRERRCEAHGERGLQRSELGDQHNHRQQGARQRDEGEVARGFLLPRVLAAVLEAVARREPDFRSAAWMSRTMLPRSGPW